MGDKTPILTAIGADRSAQTEPHARLYERRRTSVAILSDYHVPRILRDDEISRLVDDWIRRSAERYGTLETSILFGIPRDRVRAIARGCTIHEEIERQIGDKRESWILDDLRPAVPVPAPERLSDATRALLLGLPERKSPGPERFDYALFHVDASEHVHPCTSREGGWSGWSFGAGIYTCRNCGRMITEQKTLRRIERNREEAWRHYIRTDAYQPRASPPNIYKA